jgi:hypothetical protein
MDNRFMSASTASVEILSMGMSSSSDDMPASTGDKSMLRVLAAPSPHLKAYYILLTEVVVMIEDWNRLTGSSKNAKNMLTKVRFLAAVVKAGDEKYQWKTTQTRAAVPDPPSTMAWYVITEAEEVVEVVGGLSQG